MAYARGVGRLLCSLAANRCSMLGARTPPRHPPCDVRPNPCQFLRAVTDTRPQDDLVQCHAIVGDLLGRQPTHVTLVPQQPVRAILKVKAFAHTTCELDDQIIWITIERGQHAAISFERYRPSGEFNFCRKKNHWKCYALALKNTVKMLKCLVLVVLTAVIVHSRRCVTGREAGDLLRDHQLEGELTAEYTI